MKNEVRKETKVTKKPTEASITSKSSVEEASVIKDFSQSESVKSLSDKLNAQKKEEKEPHIFNYEAAFAAMASLV